MANIASIVQAIRSVTFGKDMRENIAVGIETISNQQDVYEQDLTTRQNAYEEGINTRQTSVETKQTNLENIFDAEIQNLTLADPSSAEIVQARTDSINNVTHATLKARLDGVATSLAENVQQINNLEVNKANKDEINLLATEKADKAQVTALDIKKADQAFVDSQFAAIVSGAPKGTYSTLAALQSAYPTGVEGVFLVLADGHWYYWNGTNLAWTNGGVYQSTGIADRAIAKRQLDTTLLDIMLKANSIITKIDTFDRIDLINGATSDGSTLVIPINVTGNASTIRYKNTSFICTRDCTVKLIAKVHKQTTEYIAMGQHLKTMRNGVLTTLTPTTTNVDITGDLDRVYTDTYDFKKGDYSLFADIQTANKTASATEQRIDISDFFIAEDISNYVISSNNYGKINDEFVIYQDFGSILNQKVESFNGAIKIDNNTFKIPVGNTGQASYIGADLYLYKEALNRKHKIRIYTIVSVNPSNYTLNSNALKMHIFIPNATGGFDETTVDTVTLKVNDNISVLYCDYQTTGNEDYIKLRVQTSNTVAVASDTTIYAGGFVYSILKDTTRTLNYNTKQGIEEIAGRVLYDANIQGMIDASLEAFNPVIGNKELLFDGANTTTNIVNKTIISDVIFEITQNRNTTFRVFGIKNSTRYLLPLTNLATGATSKEAVYCSKYKVLNDGFTEFEFERYNSDGEYGILKAYLLPQSNETPIQTIGDYKNRIVESNINNVATAATGIAIWGVRNNKLIGTQIVNSVVNLLESDTNYTNFVRVSDIPNTTEHPSHAEVLEDGSIVIICRTGKVLRTTDLLNFTEVLDIHNYIYAWGGFTQLDAYKNIVLVSEYRLPAEYNNVGDTLGRKLYLSEDYGVTFTAIFDLSVVMTDCMNNHIHAIKYDPYENIIWVVTGDALNKQMIWYSLDKGQNWYQSTGFNQSAVQMTSIIPLRNCVLFGSDARLVGLARYNRPMCGTMAGVKMNFDFPFIIAEGWGVIHGTNVPVGSRAAIDYENSKAYFSFLGAPYIHQDNTTDELKYGQIYATDGYTFKQIFKNDTTVDYGVIGIYEDFANKRAIGKLGLDGKFVKINSDIWTKN